MTLLTQSVLTRPAVASVGLGREGRWQAPWGAESPRELCAQAPVLVLGQGSEAHPETAEAGHLFISKFREQPFFPAQLLVAFPSPNQRCWGGGGEALRVALVGGGAGGGQHIPLL